MTVSKILPVTSPAVIRSAAAARSFSSAASSLGEFLSPSPSSTTATQRHSVSSSAGAVKLREVFILVLQHFYHEGFSTAGARRRRGGLCGPDRRGLTPIRVRTQGSPLNL